MVLVFFYFVQCSWSCIYKKTHKNMVNSNNVRLYILNVIPKGINLLQNKKRSSTIYNVIVNVKMLSIVMYFLWVNLGTQAKMFSDQLVSDYPNYEWRYKSIYNIISLVYNIRYFLKLWVKSNLVIESITNIYSCASWFERESWDMFGVFFFSNVDLRRILNDYGFSGHPLKKDYPLSGFYETSFSLILGVIHNESIKMTQEFRFFNINSPWKYNINKV